MTAIIAIVFVVTGATTVAIIAVVASVAKSLTAQETICVTGWPRHDLKRKLRTCVVGDTRNMGIVHVS